VRKKLPKENYKAKEEIDLTLKFIREWNSIEVYPKELKKWVKETRIQVSELKMLI